MDLITSETFWGITAAFIIFIFWAHQVDNRTKENLEAIQRCFDDNETAQMALGKAQNLELIKAKLEHISILLVVILGALIYMYLN